MFTAPAVAAVPYYDEPAAVVEVAAPAGRVVDTHSDHINVASILDHYTFFFNFGKKNSLFWMMFLNKCNM